MRFLHLADLHLDTLFAGRSRAVRDRLRAASREALSRGVDAALREEVDAVLLAGDLFDGERLSFATERFLLAQLQRLSEANIPVVYATGNHDPGAGLSGSGRVAWPAGTMVLASQLPRTVDIRSGDGTLVGTVTGTGHESGRVGEDLSVAMAPPAPTSVPAVALLHTQVTGAGGADAHDRYAPSELPRLREAGFDYWALGHIHTRQILNRHPGIAYPGIPQGRSPRETGAGGAFLVDIPARGAAPRIRFVELGQVRWETLALRDGLEEAHSLDALLDRIEGAWEALRQDDPGLPGGEWMVRVELAGPSPLRRTLGSEENRRELGRELEPRLGALEVEVRSRQLRSVVDPAPWLERQDAAGKALRMAEQLTRGGPEGHLERLGLEASELAGLEERDDADPDAYVRSLLEDHDGVRLLLEQFRSGDDA